MHNTHIKADIDKQNELIYNPYKNEKEKQKKPGEGFELSLHCLLKMTLYLTKSGKSRCGTILKRIKRK
jgi:hypothetical protein